MTRGLAPFWRYYGAKNRDARHYPEPRHGTIVEPFAGAAGYACLYPDRDVILLDRNPIIAAIWEWIITTPSSDILAVPDIPDGGTVDDIDAPQAARWLAGFWCNDAVVSPCKRPSAWARQKDGNLRGWGQRSRRRVATQADRIRHWRVVCGDYTDAPDIAATWFIDPPYAGRAGRHYPHQPDSFADLGAWCRERSGQVVVCEQDGADWLPFWPHKSTRSAPGKRRPDRSAEVIWTNDGPEPSLWGGRC